MSVSALHEAVSRPPRPIPWYLWLLAAGVGVVAGFAITSKVWTVLLLGGGLLAWGVTQTIARPLYGFYFTLAFYPFYTLCRGLALYLKLPIPMSVVGLWPEMVLTIMGVGVIVGCIKSGERLRLTWNDLPVAFLIASGVYAMGISIVQKELTAAVYGFHATVSPLVFYVVARWLRITPLELHRLIGFWLLPFALLAILSLIDYVVRPQLTIEIAMLVREGFWKHWDPYVFFKWYPRMQSLMFSEQFWGTICGMVAVFCLSLASLKPMPRWTIPLFLLSFICLMLSMSRGALIDWGVAVVLLVVFFRGKHRGILAITAVLSVAIGLILAAQFSQFDKVEMLLERVTALAEKDNENAYDRVSQWKYALEYFPLFPAGRGLGRAGSQALFHGTGDGSMAIADGGYFKIMAEEGLPGLLLFCIGGVGFVLVLARLLYFYRHNRNSTEYAIGQAWVCILCGLLVHNLGGNIFDAYYIQPVYWLFAGLFVTHAEGKAVQVTEGVALVPYAGGGR